MFYINFVLVLIILTSCDFVGTKLQVKNSYKEEIYVFLCHNYPDNSINKKVEWRLIPINTTHGVGRVNWTWDEIFKEHEKVTLIIVPSYNVNDKWKVINPLDPNVKKYIFNEEQLNKMNWFIEFKGF